MEKFRDYESTQKECIAQLYCAQRKHQNLEYVQKMHKKWLGFDNKSRRMTILEAIEKLDTFVDKSDPDINLGNKYHLYQTAEGLRKAGEPDWLQLTGLLHDLGKVLFLWGCNEDGTSFEQQWGVVGDTFIVGCKIPDVAVHNEFNVLNKDHNTFDKLGVWSKGCGLENMLCSWGHDEYMYHVLMNNKTKLPKIALNIIRFHSLYPWHTYGAYAQFESKDDLYLKKEIRKFNQHDLYSKTDHFDFDSFKEMQKYYTDLIEKYIGLGELQW